MPPDDRPLAGGAPGERTALLSSGPDSGPHSDDNSNSIFDSSTAQDDDSSSRSPAPDTDTAEIPVSPVRGLAVGISLLLIITLQSTNMSGITTIQGPISTSLSTSSTLLFTIAYLIPMSALGPLAGRLATIFPPRALALPIAAFFALGGLLSSRATTLPVFLTGRALSGIGGGGVLSLSVILVLQLTGSKRRGLFIGLVNSCFTFGVSFGAVVYGALLPVVGWRPLFWMQAPVALIAGTGVYFSVPASKPKDKPESIMKKLSKIDYLGAFFLILTIVLLLSSLATTIRPLLLLLSIPSLLLFILTEFRLSSNPLIPLRLLSSRGALLSCLAQLTLMSSRWTILFLSPTLMLAVRGASPAAAGSVLIPTNLGFGLGGLAVGWLHVKRKGAFWMPSTTAIACFSVSVYVLTFLTTASAPLPLFLVTVFINGFAVGSSLNYALAHLLHLSPPNTEYISSSLLGTARGFGGSFGTSIGGGIFYRLLRTNLTSGYLALDGDALLTPERQNLISKLMGAPEMVHAGGLGELDMQVAVDSYSEAMRGVWRAAAVMGLLTAVIQACTGWTAPKEVGKEVETEARARMMESEGVGEA